MLSGWHFQIRHLHSQQVTPGLALIICFYLPIVHPGDDKFPCNIIARSKVCVHTCFSPVDSQLCRCFPIKSSTAFPQWVCYQNTGVVKTIANSEPKWERKRHQHYHWTSGFGQVYYHWPSVPQIWWNQQTDNRKFKMKVAEMEKRFL